MKLRSLLFVPGDRPDRFDKAAASGADALILDLEDSVVADNKPMARTAVAEFLAQRPALPCFVRVNPLDSAMTRLDMDAISTSANGIVLPKSSGAASIRAFVARYGATPILPIATETPSAIFTLGSFAEVNQYLLGLTWGAEDLSAAIGATSARMPDGRYTAPFEMVRSLALFAAHAAKVAAIETVYPAIDDLDGLTRYVADARRDGFNGMMAIHPKQVAIINAGFVPDQQQIAEARAVVAAFADNPDAGALRLDGRMIDRPHLLQAQRILALADTE